MTSIPGASEVRALVATLILPAPRGRAAADAHDVAAARAPSGAGPAPVVSTPKAKPVTPAPATQTAHAQTQPAPPAHEETASAGLLVTLAELREIMTTLQQTKAADYITPLNKAMVEFHIDNRLREAAFLGQVAHESGELKWFHEFASGMEYDMSRNPKLAKGLGNVNPGDGPRYKGRGPIQLTGRANYRACGKALGLDLEGNPDIAVQPGVAFRTAGWFWDTHGLNALADKEDYKLITRRINGGYNGYDDRVKYYERALKVFPAGGHA
jgi:putative chitinase